MRNLFLFFIQSLGFAQALPAQPGQSPAGTAPEIFQLPTLRYLSVNPANPRNYFNFLLDKGNPVDLRGLHGEAKKLINYFFLGITLPDQAFWVNLQPGQQDKITSSELSKTDLGKTLLEQDLLLKKAMAKLLHPQNPKGKEFWATLYQRIADSVQRIGPNYTLLAKRYTLNKLTITTNNRVWIVPEEAQVMETEDGALITSAKLKVMLETNI